LFKKKTLILFFLIVVFLLTSSQLLPQAGRGRGRISGKVADEEGNPIPSAKITLQFQEDEELIKEAVTDKKGKWKIGGLGSGYWIITVSAQGFIPYQKNINVSQLERNPPVNIVLQKAEEQFFKEAPEIELFEKGSALFKEGRFEEAISSFQQFLATNPELYQIHFSIGNSYKELRNFEQALKEYQIVLENVEEGDEKNKKLKAKTLAAIGECYLMMDRIDSAQDYFRQSLELSPDDEILAYNVGEIYFAHQKLDEAIEYYKLASQIKPKWSDPYYKIGLVYLNKKDNEKAIDYFLEFLEIEPDSARSVNVKNIINYLKKR
jgi:tetratricopeptide (TPR) repeat protein